MLKVSRVAALAILAAALCPSQTRVDEPSAPSAIVGEALKLLRAGKAKEAESLLDRPDVKKSRVVSQVGDLNLDFYAVASLMLISAYEDRGSFADAGRIARDRLAWAELRQPGQPLQVAGFAESLADAYRLQFEYDKAEPLYRRALSLQQSMKLGDCLSARTIYTGLGESLIALTRLAEAEALLRAGVDSCQQKFQGRAPTADALLNVLVVALETDGQKEAASVTATEASRSGAFTKPIFQEEERDFLRSRLLGARGKFDEAIALCDRWVDRFGVSDDPSDTEFERRQVEPLRQLVRLLHLAGREREAAATQQRLEAVRAKFDIKF